MVFLAHERDTTGALHSFVVLDFPAAEMRTIASWSEANARRVDTLLGDLLTADEPASPHSTVTCVPGESFHAFSFGAATLRHFHHVDFRGGEMRILPAGLLAGPGAMIEADGMGCTLATNRHDPTAFFASLRVPPDAAASGTTIRYYRTERDLGSAVEIFRRNCAPSDFCPHVTCRIDNLLVSSEFDFDEFRLLRGGARFADFRDLVGHVAAHSVGDAEWQWLHAEIATNGAHGLPPESLDRFFLQAQASAQYRFDLAPGVIRFLPVGGRREHVVQLDFSKPAHFVAGCDGSVYLSCHNLFYLNQRNYFVGPAAILKLRPDGGLLVPGKFFSDPSGFRFTSHVVFQRDGREFVATFGNPNRLFIVDGESMETVASRDMGKTNLPELGGVGYAIGSPNFERHAIKALCVSADGELLMFPSEDDLVIVSTRTLDEVARLDVVQRVSRLTGWSPRDIRNQAHHVGIL